MEIEHNRRSLVELYKDRGTINLTPMWQRGVAWNQQKQVLLIDSILRGMDMPKIYLWRRKPHESFDVVDGQQRLRAVWDFFDGKYALNHAQPLQAVGQTKIAGKLFSELTPLLQKRLRDFQVSIAEIKKAPIHDITLLFARLQLAAPLNSAELRNAILCPLRHEVDATALNHDFFSNCRISSKRMKRQDYTAHAYALAINGDRADLKAPDLKELYIQSLQMSQEELMQVSSQVSDAFNLLLAINLAANQKITQKWMFCDLTYFLIKKNREPAKVDTNAVAEIYREFETRRLTHINDANTLLEGKHNGADQDLYDYIQAFRIEGGRQGNLATRAIVMEKLFEDCIS